MPRKLILHVGTQKTGTSSIQYFMNANRKKLRKRGYCYPKFSARWSYVGFRRNAYFLYRGAAQDMGLASKKHSGTRIAVCKSELAKQLEGFDGDVVMSDEGLWHFCAGVEGGAEGLKAYADSLGFTDYKIIVYVRRQDLFIESVWKQRLKRYSDRSYTFEEYCGEKYSLAVCDYLTGMNNLERVFGRENVELHIYDRSQLVEGDSAADFLSILGLDINDGFIKPEEEQNDSIKGNAFAELKRLAALCPAYASGENFLRKPITEFSISKGDEVAGGVFTPEERTAYLERYKEGNAILAQRYFGRDDLFGPNKVDNQPKWEPVAGEMGKDAFLVLTQALAEEHARCMELEKRIERFEDRISYLEQVNRNSLGLKVERALRGSKMKRSK